VGLNPPFSGTCICGEVKYICSKAPVWSVNCHCRACQKLSGAPYVSAFSVPAGSVELTGDLTSFIRTAASGNEVTTSVCSQCGTRICAQSAGATHLLNIFAATLDDQSGFAPISNVYLSEAVGWIDPPPAQFNFQEMPKA
jgi:hypothetical protein